MSAANGKSAERRLRRRRRKLAAATSTVLLVAVAVAGEPISLAAGVTQVAGGIGGGLKGMTDPSAVGASGRLNDDDEIGDYLLDNAGDVDSLLKLGGDAPSEDQLGIPSTLYEAYSNAAYLLAESQPNCNLDWSLVASIGRIESNHARHGKVDIDGNTTPNILGPVLNGGGFAAIQDTDGGKWDGDNRWDRAVGSMQFIPSTWEAYKADGNDDGVMSPHNVFDETVAAGKYLCSGDLDLSNDKDRAAAVFRYNHSDSYVATVLLWADAYANGFSTMPDYDVPSDAYSDDGYSDDGDGFGGNVAQGPSSNGGTTQPSTTPTTNPPSSSTTTPTTTTTKDGSPRPTQPPPTTTCATPTTETTSETTTSTEPVPPPTTTCATPTTETTSETTTSTSTEPVPPPEPTPTTTDPTTTPETTEPTPTCP